MRNWTSRLRQSPILLALFFGLAGCATFGSGGGAIGEVNLFSSPMALALGSGSAPSAIGVRVYAVAPGGSRGIPIRQGTLEVLMFDAAVSNPGLTDMQPLKTWTFTAAQLKDLSDTSSLGDGYQLILKWENAQPKSRVITVVARYRNLAGMVIYSAPSSISVAVK